LYPQAKAEYSRLIELSQEALTLARKLKNLTSEADALTKLGQAYSFFQDNQKAIELLQQSLKIARETNDLSTEKTAIINLSVFIVTWEITAKKLNSG
jgi:tetratricopeptide (TPR) repeat protein